MAKKKPPQKPPTPKSEKNRKSNTIIIPSRPIKRRRGVNARTGGFHSGRRRSKSKARTPLLGRPTAIERNLTTAKKTGRRSLPNIQALRKWPSKYKSVHGKERAYLDIPKKKIYYEGPKGMLSSDLTEQNWHIISHFFERDVATEIANAFGINSKNYKEMIEKLLKNKTKGAIDEIKTLNWLFGHTKA